MGIMNCFVIFLRGSKITGSMVALQIAWDIHFLPSGVKTSPCRLTCSASPGKRIPSIVFRSSDVWPALSVGFVMRRQTERSGVRGAGKGQESVRAEYWHILMHLFIY